jgi:hypothetical protein
MYFEGAGRLVMDASSLKMTEEAASRHSPALQNQFNDSQDDTLWCAIN